MSATIFLEGGGSGPDSKLLVTLCRKSFTLLLKKCGFEGHMSRLFASGSRVEALKDFCRELKSGNADEYIAMWIDSEDPLTDIEAVWQHLNVRDKWKTPVGATDDQVLFMTTCMETLIVADRAALKEHYGSQFQESALPPMTNLESRDRGDVQNRLDRATRNCSNRYAKGKRSFELLARLNPATLEQHLPSFKRARRILNEKLKPA